MILRRLHDLARTAAMGAAVIGGVIALCWAAGLASIP